MKTRRLTLFILLAILLPYNFQVYTRWTSSFNNQNSLSKHASEGKLLWQQKNCASCHQIYGLGGYLGPDLTNVISSKGMDYARTFIETGTQKMPNLHLNKIEIDAVLAYLSHIDSSGVYPAKNFEPNWDGTLTHNE